MTFTATAMGVAAGICFAFAAQYLFIGLRRPASRRLDLWFAAFALAYGGSIVTAVPMYAAGSLAEYVGAARLNACFAAAAYVAIVWYVSVYTGVQPRRFLLLVSAGFAVLLVAIEVRSALVFESLEGLKRVSLPWGESVAVPEVTEGPWTALLYGLQLLVIGFLGYACLRQFRAGEPRRALALGSGLAVFVAAVLFDALVEAALIDFVLLTDFAFVPLAVIVSLRMSSDAIRTKEELSRYRTQLEAMVEERTAELEEAQARITAQASESAVIEERGRLARDLHDAVTQTLYSAALIAEALPSVWERSPEQGRRSLGKLRQLTRAALAEMRTLLFELRPTALETAALAELVPQQCDAFTGRSGVPVDATVDGEGELPVDVKIALYRIAQEALANAAKHAQARRVEVTLRHSAKRAFLRIRDDGVGFDPAARAPERMGLSIMLERAAGVGADLQIESEPGRGTVVTASWALEEAPPQEGEGEAM